MSQETKKSRFIPFVVPFGITNKDGDKELDDIVFLNDGARNDISDPDISADSVRQAKVFLDRAAELHAQGFAEVGLTYAANHEQTDDIRSAYSRGKNITGIHGGNQAEVIRCIEWLLQTEQYSNLQGVFRILPVTTCVADGGDPRPVRNSWLLQDLFAILKFLARGNTAVLGWQNQNTNGSNYPFGGGLSKALTQGQRNIINTVFGKFNELWGVDAVDVDEQVNSSEIGKFINDQFPRRELTYLQLGLLILIGLSIVGIPADFYLYYKWTFIDIPTNDPSSSTLPLILEAQPPQQQQDQQQQEQSPQQQQDQQQQEQSPQQQQDQQEQQGQEQPSQ